MRRAVFNVVNTLLGEIYYEKEILCRSFVRDARSNDVAFIMRNNRKYYS